MEAKVEQVITLVKTYVRKQKPLMIHGTMGIGKSDIVRQAARDIAKEKGLIYTEGIVNVVVSRNGIENVQIKHEYKDPETHFFLMDVRITSLEPSDLRGIPFPDGNVVRWLSPNWLPKDGQGLLFLDEMNLAPPSIQASAYQLVLDRKVGEYEMPKGWSIISAGNRAVDKANIFPMAAPLKNRFSHVEMLIPTEEEWREWAADNGIKNDIIAFMAFKPSFLFRFDAKSKDNAFPTPRSWANASYMTQELDGSTQAKLDEELILVASCVGEGVALEYQAFVKLKKKINLADLLKNPKKVKDITDVGLKYSLISGLAEKYKSDRKLMPDILAVVEHMDAEFGIFLLRIMKGQSKTFKEDLVKCPNWKAVFSKNSKYIF